MGQAVQISFDGLDSSEAVRTRIEAEVLKLERYCGRITSARVVIALAGRHKQQGKLFEVRIHLTLPGRSDVVVTRWPPEHQAHEDPLVAIEDAFKTARRQIEDKTHSGKSHRH